MMAALPIDAPMHGGKPLMARQQAVFCAQAGIRCHNLNLYSLAINHKLGEHMTTICKWGNSLGLRLPAPVALAAGFKSGTHVGVRLLDNGSLLITPRSGAVAVSEAQTLVKAMPPENKW